MENLFLRSLCLSASWLHITANYTMNLKYTFQVLILYYEQRLSVLFTMNIKCVFANEVAGTASWVTRIYSCCGEYLIKVLVTFVIPILSRKSSNKF